MISVLFDICSISARAPVFPESLCLSLLPQCHITLVDSLQKRTRFLDCVVSTLSLSNVTVLRSRVEDISSSFNGSFDAVVTRATVSLPSFFQLCSRFIQSHGFLASIKGEHISDELESLHTSIDLKVFQHSRCCSFCS